MMKQYISAFSLYLLAIINCSLLYRNFGSSNLNVYTRSEFSYKGRDYPSRLQITKLPSVALMLQESEHYGLDGIEAAGEWAHLVPTPEGFGWIRLGDEDRLFIPSIFHQFHCLQMLQRALSSLHRNDTPSEHVEHCFNYLRSGILCTAADNLEEGDFMSKNYSAIYSDLNTEKSGPTVVCEDWSMAFEWIVHNFKEWCENSPEVRKEDCIYQL